MDPTEEYLRMHPDEFIAKVYGFTLLLRREGNRIYGHPEDAIPFLASELELQGEAANDAQLAARLGISLHHDLPLQHVFLYEPLPSRSRYALPGPAAPYMPGAAAVPPSTADTASEGIANRLGITLREGDDPPLETRCGD